MIDPAWPRVVLLMIGVNLTFFFVAGGLFHWAFYRQPASQLARWQHQPGRRQTWSMILGKVPLVLLNGVLLNTIIGLGLAASVGRYGSAYWRVSDHGVPYLIGSTLALFFCYHGGLFYFHKTMHRPALFRAIHRVHHKFKAPMFLDALYEHPLEACYGGLVVSLPLFLFPVNLYGFFVFFAIVGAHEIIDHSGINLNLPFLSKSRHHDDHHLRSACYYGQLLSLLDNVHGTVLTDEQRAPVERRRRVG